MSDAFAACSEGHRNSEGAIFCSTCGERIGATSGTQLPTLLVPPGSSAASREEVEGDKRGSAEGGSDSRHDSDPSGPADSNSTLPVKGRHWNLRLIIAGAAVLVLGALLLNALFGPDTTTLRGIATLTDRDGSIEGEWDSCQGTGGYSDFTAGARLSIRGRNGEIVGSGSVRNVDDSVMQLLAENDAKDNGSDASDAGSWRSFLRNAEGVACVLYFEAEVEDSDYYSVEIASRGALEYSKAELEETDYFIQMGLGD